MHRYRDYVRFEREVTVSDGGGGQTGEWQTFCERNCWIERMENFRFDVERIQNGGVGAMPIVRIHLRADPDTKAITSGFRAFDVDRGVHMNVNFSQDIGGRNAELIITCTERGPS